MTNPRGRPREYDPDQALDAAMMVFWAQGFSGTSLDDLASAMNMNRPSLYNAFGDKESLYRLALAGVVAELKRGVGASLSAEPDLEKGLRSFYYSALEIYFATEPAPGCFVMCTAPVEALTHPEVRSDVRAVIAELDGVLSRRFAKAQADRQFPAAGDPKAAAKVAQAVLHSLAIRARSGESKASLRKMARDAVRVLST